MLIENIYIIISLIIVGALSWFVSALLAKSGFESAYSQLKSGSGNLVGQAEKLRDLGLKTKKKLPSWLANSALSDTESPGPL